MDEGKLIALREGRQVRVWKERSKKKKQDRVAKEQLDKQLKRAAKEIKKKDLGVIAISKRTRDAQEKKGTRMKRTSS